jgi:hypothetical protein
VKLYTLYSDPTKKRRTSYLIEDTRGNFTTATALSKESLVSDIIYLNDNKINKIHLILLGMSIHY